MNLEMKNISMSYPGITVFRDLDFTLEEGKITCLLGPSGCGKTTLLNLLAGTVKAQKGEITPDTTGRIAFLFQESRLLPWLNVLDNVTYLMDRHLAKDGIRKQGMLLIEKVGLKGFENSYPAELSGGMERRVSIARALGKNAALFLMDEPFSSLDDSLKDRMTDLMKDLFRKEKRTVLHITHDKRTANEIADRIVHMERLNDRTVIREG